MILNMSQRGKKMMPKIATHPQPIRPLLPSNMEFPVSRFIPNRAQKYFQNLPIPKIPYFDARVLLS